MNSYSMMWGVETGDVHRKKVETLREQNTKQAVVAIFAMEEKGRKLRSRESAGYEPACM